MTLLTALPLVEKTGWPFDQETSPQALALPDGSKDWPRISIVIPSFQQGAFLEETLRSVLLQAYPDLEVLVVDGGSSDDSVEILQRYDSWIAWWTSEHDSGQSDAINKGFRRATGEIMTFLGSDDVYEPGTLHDVARRYLEHPECGVIVGAFRFMDTESRRVSAPISARLPGQGPEDLALLHPSQWRLHQVSAFYTRHALDAVGRHVVEDLHYTMDRELLYRVARRYGVVLSSLCYGAFRLHSESKSVAEVLPMSQEMGALHLRDAPADESKPIRRLRRAFDQHHRSKGYLKLAGSGVSRLRAAQALLQALRLQPSLLFRKSYARRWLNALLGKTRS